MKLIYEVKDFIKPINKDVLVDFIKLRGYNIIFLVIPDDNDIQMIVIDKTETTIEIDKVEIQDKNLIIYYYCDEILNLKHNVVLSKILFYYQDRLIIDFMSDKNNNTYYIPELQNALTKFESKKIADLLLYSDIEIRELFKDKNISTIIMEDPIYHEDDFSEGLYETTLSEDDE